MLFKLVTCPFKICHRIYIDRYLWALLNRLMGYGSSFDGSHVSQKRIRLGDLGLTSQLIICFFINQY
jgi:hypothetical protein